MNNHVSEDAVRKSIIVVVDVERFTSPGFRPDTVVVPDYSSNRIYAV